MSLNYDTPYRMREVPITAEPGTRVDQPVYLCRKHDYGSASDDTLILGRRHVSVTLKSDGDYPFFTIDASWLSPWEGPLP